MHIYIYIYICTHYNARKLVKKFHQFVYVQKLFYTLAQNLLDGKKQCTTHTVLYVKNLFSPGDGILTTGPVVKSFGKK